MNSTIRRISCPSCGLEQPYADGCCAKCQSPIPVLQGRYKLMWDLKRGGLSILYVAQDTFEQREVLLKALRKDNQENSNAAVRFGREIRATKALSERSPHAITFIDAGHDPLLGEFMVIEYLQGQTLKERFKQGTDIAYPTTFHIFFQLCDVLSDAHVMGYVHRGIQASNVFLTSRNGDPYYVKLLDFGLVKPLRNNKHPGITKGLLGSPAYMAPEQTTSSSIDERADVYSLGILFYQMLTGTLPFQYEETKAMIQAHLWEMPDPLALRRPDLLFPPGLESALFKAIAKKRGDRYDAIEEFAESMAAFATLEELPQPNSRQQRHTIIDTHHLPPPSQLPPQLELLPVDPKTVEFFHEEEHNPHEQPPATGSKLNNQFWLGLILGLLSALGIFVSIALW